MSNLRQRRDQLKSIDRTQDVLLQFELLSLEQLKQHATALASKHQIEAKLGQDQLLPRLDSNERVLLSIYELLTQAVRAKRMVSPAGEWLLDNFHMIEEQIRTARRHLPRGYSRSLPHLINPGGGGLPRVYDIALEIIGHVDGRIDLENINAFVAAYQKVASLNLGEFWAIPIMLRLALIENIRRVAELVGAAIRDRGQAAFWTEKLLYAAEHEPQNLILVVADMARSQPPMSNAFVAELVRSLQGHSPALDMPFTWLEQQLAASGRTSQQMIQMESQQQAANQVSISASIGSLRFLGSVDWRTFVESLNLTAATLSRDPGGIYDRMDFATRDRYRHVVEKLAKLGNMAEPEVAERAIKLAEMRAGCGGKYDRKSHVGYFLIDAGLAEVERYVLPKWHMRLANAMRWHRRREDVLFVGGVSVITGVLSVLIMAPLTNSALSSATWSLLFAAALIPSSQLAIELINRCVTTLAKPALLPRLDFSGGIPDDYRTLVCVPTLLISRKNVEDLLAGLEVRYLANRAPNLFFALITDFTDSTSEVTSLDADLVELARLGIESLNARYVGSRKEDGTRQDVFFLLHRPREWNESEQVWMGYERKRGKLEALNALLRGRPGHKGKDASDFSVISGDISPLMSVKYVITLDTDTMLPKDAAAKLVATIAHPLNRAEFGTNKHGMTEQVVTRGYGILQPRVAVNLPSTSRSWFSRLYTDDPGVDPYTRAVSDVYQDLFQEGSFVGKGIYDVDAFSQAVTSNLPENLILSHDLIEGCYARCGLVSDVILYEDHPSHFCDEAMRRHRWIRGDWQIAFWLLPFVPDLHRRWKKNPIKWLAKWKIFDNLRRSLVPIAALTFLLLGWLTLPNPWYVSGIVAMIYVLPVLGSFIADAFCKSAEAPLGAHLQVVTISAVRRLVRAFLALVFLPFEAAANLDAIGKSIVRMLLTQRHLLAWRSTTDPRHRAVHNFGPLLRSTALAPVSSIFALTAIYFLAPGAVTSASPFLFSWFMSPMLAYGLSRPIIPSTANLSDSQIDFLRRLARLTWRYFETFVGPDEQWLPPDNFQEYPAPVSAHRTSPTNIGMSLLANLAAYDFGYISAHKLLERTEQTFRTLSKMERFRGHFYNWYDTQTLQPLFPRYISTVDSGNLAGLLLTLRPGLNELADEPVISRATSRGLHDTISCLSEVPALSVNAKARLRQIQIGLDSEVLNSGRAHRLNNLISETVSEISVAADDEDLKFWLSALTQQCADCLGNPLKELTPWSELNVPEDVPWLDQILDLGAIPTLRQIAQLRQTQMPLIDILISASVAGKEWLIELRRMLEVGIRCAEIRLLLSRELADMCEDFSVFEYEFLYDASRHLMAIGYNVSEHRRDDSFYDLLASEARLGSFVGIAQGYLPQDHWFALGRQLTSVKGEPTLLSWSGSMFEYLMPLLVMPNYQGTLLDQTYSAAVRRQIEYGKQRGVPWGISESGYNATDMQLNYQYRAFGVPGLGFKRGLAEDLVIAPYATVMALMVAPVEACKNLQNMAQQGFLGRYGFFEAIDFTASRVSADRDKAIVRSYMAHHQGMSLLAILYQLLDKKMQRRFLSEPYFRAVELLLHERVPKVAALYPHAPEVSEAASIISAAQAILRVIKTPNTPRPEVHLLSNGNYHVMVTNAGGGYSRWRNFAVTRWREDPTCDNWGTFCYIRDVGSAKLWSAAHQPTLKLSPNYEAIFTPSKAEFRRRDYNIDVHTEITVSPEDDIELRRFTITNLSQEVRTLEITSYAEIVLAPQESDVAHPAFSNLFIQTKIIGERHAILCSRRPRTASEKIPSAFHLLTVHGQNVGEVSYETDRSHFIGRGRNTVFPAGAADAARLLNHDGSVLDPIVAIKCRIRIEPEKSIKIHTVTGVGDSREHSLALIEKYHDSHIADRVFDMAWTHQNVALRQFNVSPADAQLYGAMASAVIYSNPARRVSPMILIKNRRGQDGLWGYGISGDLPIVLLRVSEESSVRLLRQMIQAHGYWQRMGLAVDLVIWNEDESGYRQRLQDLIMSSITAGDAVQQIDRSGGIYVRRTEQMSEEDRILMQSVARVIISDKGGTLAEQLERRGRGQLVAPLLQPSVVPRTEISGSLEVALLPKDLMFANQFGGFSADGREYYIRSTPETITPAPWVNVLANPYFGTIVSESSSSYTWCENAHEFRLTPWFNDAVTDHSGEAVYIRDEESGRFWSPTPLPTRAKDPYVICHGFGYSKFTHISEGIQSELTIFVASDAPVKILQLRLLNRSGRRRRISATAYCEWTLGELRAKSAPHVMSHTDLTNGALCARNPYHTEFGGRIAFLNVSEKSHTFTSDRSEFIGRNGTHAAPMAMYRTQLSGRVGAAIDPCGAMQSIIDLDIGEESELVFVIGVGRDDDDARTLVRRFCTPLAAQRALDEVVDFWQSTLSSVQIKTPMPAIDVLANGWLTYQVLSSRMWARSGFYQSGGAYGFRDQLQDAMALINTRPRLLREQLLRCASRQFREGDVQHWWHPPSGRGTRTHFSDDYLWLPLAVSRYVQSIGDLGVLDVNVEFIEGRQVKPDEEGYSDIPKPSDESGTLYEHCVRAINHSFRFGSHGLPLIGCGDWNDGMNLIGEHGRGESVWLGFFLCEVLKEFAVVAERHGDHPFAEICLTQCEYLRQNLEKNGWDGAWYRRAYFDDGQPLGSITNTECQIDSLPQSWAVLSGVADKQRAREGMINVSERLVDRGNCLIKLFDPPFDKSDMNPGYIKGYVPGVRENGGQYTHAAIWSAMAFAALGDTSRAWELTNLINPVNHGMTAAGIATYKVEPYVMAADVYGVSPHAGRGGWTWYTGSAGWMYRLITESLLGLRLEINKLYIEPNVPEDWTEFEMIYRYRNTEYHITLRPASDTHAKGTLIVDGVTQAGAALALVDDLQVHEVDMYYGVRHSS